MNRKEFLSQLGFGAAFALTATCLGGCLKDKREINNVDLEIDLDDPQYADIKVPGGFVIVDLIVIARTIEGKYVAATRTCSHDQLNEIIFDSTSSKWTCTAHSAIFDLEGNGENENGANGLNVYQTELDISTNILRIFSV